MADFIVRKLLPGEPREGICGPARCVADGVEYNLTEDEQLVPQDAVNLRLESSTILGSQREPLAVEMCHTEPTVSADLRRAWCAKCGTEVTALIRDQQYGGCAKCHSFETTP